jgi:hypothetical protein
VFLSRSPLSGRSQSVRLACIRHAASVDPEPGSNSSSVVEHPPLCPATPPHKKLQNTHHTSVGQVRPAAATKNRGCSNYTARCIVRCRMVCLPKRRNRLSRLRQKWIILRHHILVKLFWLRFPLRFAFPFVERKCCRERSSLTTSGSIARPQDLSNGCQRARNPAWERHISSAHQV